MGSGYGVLRRGSSAAANESTARTTTSAQDESFELEFSTESAVCPDLPQHVAPVPPPKKPLKLIGGRYHVLRRIGTGATASVFECEDVQQPDAPHVAIKVMLGAEDETDDEDDTEIDARIRADAEQDSAKFRRQHRVALGEIKIHSALNTKPEAGAPAVLRCGRTCPYLSEYIGNFFESAPRGSRESSCRSLRSLLDESSSLPSNSTFGHSLNQSFDYRSEGGDDSEFDDSDDDEEDIFDSFGPFGVQGSGVMCIVTEYCDGGSLAEVAHAARACHSPSSDSDSSTSSIQCSELGCISEAEMADLCASMVLALRYMHQRGAIHRDVKSDNILLTTDGHCKLVDFGISSFIHQDGRSGSIASAEDAPVEIEPERPGMKQTLCGTPAFMAPEVIANSVQGVASFGTQEQQQEQQRRQPHVRKGYTTRADIWSLGITAIELADGWTPSGRLHWHNAVGLLSFVTNSPSPALSAESSTSHWTPLFRSFLEHCLQKDPELRSSAVELARHPFVADACIALQTNGGRSPRIAAVAQRAAAAAAAAAERKKRRSAASKQQQALGAAAAVSAPATAQIVKKSEETSVPTAVSVPSADANKLHIVAAAAVTPKMSRGTGTATDETEIDTAATVLWDLSAASVAQAVADAAARASRRHHAQAPLQHHMWHKWRTAVGGKDAPARVASQGIDAATQTTDETRSRGGGGHDSKATPVHTPAEKSNASSTTAAAGAAVGAPTKARPSKLALAAAFHARTRSGGSDFGWGLLSPSPSVSPSLSPSNKRTRNRRRMSPTRSPSRGFDFDTSPVARHASARTVDWDWEQAEAAKQHAMVAYDPPADEDEDEDSSPDDEEGGVSIRRGSSRRRVVSSADPLACE